MEACFKQLKDKVEKQYGVRAMVSGVAARRGRGRASHCLAATGAQGSVTRTCRRSRLGERPRPLRQLVRQQTSHPLPIAGRVGASKPDTRPRAGSTAGPAPGGVTGSVPETAQHTQAHGTPHSRGAHRPAAHTGLRHTTLTRHTQAHGTDAPSGEGDITGLKGDPRVRGSGHWAGPRRVRGWWAGQEGGQCRAGGG